MSLKVFGQRREGFELQEVPARWGRVDYLVFEDPGAVVGDEDGV